MEENIVSNFIESNFFNNSSEEEIEFVMEQSWDYYLQLFSCVSVDELISHLKKLDHDAGSVCARKMIRIGGWKCSNCEKNGNAIICHQCWSKIKEKHEKHNIKYNCSTNGTCDCGDLNTVNESLICPQHKGPLKKEEDIQNYINKCFNPKLLQSLEKYTEDLIQKLLSLNHNINSMRDVTEQLIGLIDVLSNNNAIIHVLSKIFLKNFKIKTKHNCLLINDNEIKLITKDNEIHDCVCPFIRHLMESWIDGNQDIIYRFLLNYKLRKTMGILYFILYEHFVKYCIDDFCDLSVQYIFDACETVANNPYYKSLFRFPQQYN